ncbi:MAG: voltage-gated potassium channel [Solirubrobacterales bacterium]|jgi:voltage-gated potassium channel|nr:voltage-gated potassium channel [Solirubrobacterales bacterium]
MKPLAEPLTARRAAQIIMIATFLVTLAGGVLIWLLDHKEFPNLGTSMWWALQTVTTVGYGDVVPADTKGRIIGAVLMLQGIGLITVVAAAVTATLIEQVRKRRNTDDEDSVTAMHLKRIEARLDEIERALSVERRSTDEPDDSAP